MIKESKFNEHEINEINSLIAIREDPSKCYFDDPQILDLSKRFVKLAFLMDKDDQDQFTKLYIQHIAGVDQAEENWSMRVGLNMSGGGEKPPQDGVTFWRELKQCIPEALTPEEIDTLIKKDPTAGGAFDIVCLIDNFNCKSPLLHSMMVSIIAWK